MRRTMIAASLVAAAATALPPMAWAAGEQPPPVPGNLAEEATWFVVIDGQTLGPLTDSAVERRIADGSITDDTLVWRAGMESWAPARDAPGMQAVRIEAAIKNPNKPTRTDNKFDKALGLPVKRIL